MTQTIRTTAAALCLLAAVPSIAQKHGMGLNFDKKKYGTVQRMSFGFNFTVDPEPAHSLKAYCPTPGDQGPTASCVGWATGYGAFSIAYCKKNNITDMARKNEVAMNGMYVYKKILPPYSTCHTGTTPEDALNLLYTNGDCRYNSYKPNGCEEMPTAANDNEAKNYKIKGFGKLFEEGDLKENKILAVKRAIANDDPVVVGIKVTTSLGELNSEVWIPNDKYTSVGGHALVVVGYDNMDRQFEMMNSWGTSWGNGGFFKMSYDDFAELVMCAYTVNVGPAQQDERTIAGSFHFRKYVSKNSAGKNQFTDVVPTLTGQLYSTIVGYGNYYKLKADHMTEGSMVYVFSVKPDGSKEVIYGDKAFGKKFGFTVVDAIPNNPDTVVKNTPVVPDESAYLDIPEGEKAFTADQRGNDYLIILFASSPIKNLETSIATLKNADDIHEQLRGVFGSALVNTAEVSYDGSDMKVKAKVSPTSYIVPIVLKATVN